MCGVSERVYSPLVGSDAISEGVAVDYDAPRRRMGRPPLSLPAKIDASPEEIARKVMNTLPLR